MRGGASDEWKRERVKVVAPYRRRSTAANVSPRWIFFGLRKEPAPSAHEKWRTRTPSEPMADPSCLPGGWGGGGEV